MSEKTINIASNGTVSPDPCPLSKASDVLFCNNHAGVPYELSFTNGSPFDGNDFTIPAGAVHHLIGAPDNGIVGRNYPYDCVEKTQSGAAADPTIIITK